MTCVVMINRKMAFLLTFVFLIILNLSAATTVNKDFLDGILKDGEEGNLNSMLDKIGGALGELVDAVGSLKSECKYECPYGSTPSPKPGHEQSSNGCGSYGLEIDTAPLPLMTKCCDEHDYCYDTCNSQKEKCDSTFKSCLLKMCNKIGEELDEEEYEGCKATAELMYTGTTMLGCSPFQEAQSNACTCVPTNKKRKNIEKKTNSKSGTKVKPRVKKEL